MKTIIRQGTFESNSSSTHSISIVNKEKDVISTFPRNSEYCIWLEPSEVANGEERISVIYKMMSEVAKAKFILNVITSYIDHNEDKYPEIAYWIDYDNRIPNNNRNFETLIKQKPFVWFKEILEEETGTEFKFEKPIDDYFPYYSYLHDDDRELEDIFKCDWQNEKSFKNFMRNIVFNDDIIIVDTDEPYYNAEGMRQVEIM